MGSNNKGLLKQGVQMRLLCFMGLSAGGLVCDLLNGTKSKITTQGVQNFEHSVLKGVTPYMDKGPFNERLWKVNLIKYSLYHQKNENDCIGTHTHPSFIPQSFLDEFSEVFVITCLTKQSKIYMYLRYKHLYYDLIPDPESICRDFAPIDNCTPIEFSDIVNGDFVKQYNLDESHFEEWKYANKFLYTLPTKDELIEFENLLKQYNNIKKD